MAGTKSSLILRVKWRTTSRSSFLGLVSCDALGKEGGHLAYLCKHGALDLCVAAGFISFFFFNLFTLYVNVCAVLVIRRHCVHISRVHFCNRLWSISTLLSRAHPILTRPGFLCWSDELICTCLFLTGQNCTCASSSRSLKTRSPSASIWHLVREEAFCASCADGR